MGVYERNNHWYIDYYFNGKRLREAVTIPKKDSSKITHTDALKALSIRKAEIAEGRFNISQTKPQTPFKKLCNEYLEYCKNNKRSWKRDEQSIKHFLEYFKNKTLQQLNSWIIEKYKSERKEIVRQSTVNRELDTLRNMLNKAVDWGMIESSPYKVKHFRVNNTNLRIISDEEFDLLYESSSLDLKPILLSAVSTGMRLGELLSLKWNDINLNIDGFITVRDSKNYESRTIPINSTLLKTLSDLKKHSESEYVFEGRKTIRSVWIKALKTSGIAHCRFHDLRHTFASRLVMNGVDLVTVAELMGHKDITMTKRYSHPTPEHKKHAVESLIPENSSHKLDTKREIDELSKSSKTNVTVLKQ